MQKCNLSYIPKRLHQEDKPTINFFEIGEFLYRRCKPIELQNPFATISITELSHNRAGLQENILCNADDVLYSINVDEEFERYDDKVVCTLKIKDLNENSTYQKQYSQEKKEETYNCIIELLHEPETCMYPHCVFRVWINNEVVTYDNHDTTLKKLTYIRTQLKEELASMILKRQISQSDTPMAM